MNQKTLPYPPQMRNEANLPSSPHSDLVATIANLKAIVSDEIAASAKKAIARCHKAAAREKALANGANLQRRLEGARALQEAAIARARQEAAATHARQEAAAARDPPGRASQDNKDEYDNDEYDNEGNDDYDDNDYDENDDKDNDEINDDDDKYDGNEDEYNDND
jgi:hypothetical protein